MSLISLVFLIAAWWMPGAAPSDSIEVVAEVSCPGVETVFLYRFGGLHFDKAYQTGVKDGKAVFRLPEQDWRFYYLGAGDQDVLPVIVGQEKQVLIRVNCERWATSEIVDSPIHREYQSIKSQINGLKNQGAQLTKQHYAQLSGGQTPEAFVDAMGRVDQRKLAFLQETAARHPFFGQIVAFNTYLSYFVQPHEYANEVDYFAGEYFRFVQWDRPGLEDHPWVFESFKAYADALADTRMTPDQLVGYIDRGLGLVPAGSRTYLLALSGVIGGLEKANPEAFVPFARRYIDQYGKTQPKEAQALQEKIGAKGALVAGAEAPEFSQADPEGNPVSLRSLRGKVLLIDFWASWCGPCRRENPKVRQLYDRYKDQGFDILGVSLDSDRQRWLDAIQKDGLVWTQVSDLQGWRNAAGQLYQVSSIPHTVLLDREGRIIARGLRGAALEQKLAELFGS
ncbi:MAG: TlpA family protein disulfide reductase [Saprospiraceae bacterium]|nr:TlpA family protein disulfide reductase [Saprospiraceae bacterium]